MDECLALADLGASINIMPLSVWEALSLSKLTPTCMTLELADRSVSKLIGTAKDVSFKVGVFHFPADFLVLDFEADPRVSLILGSEPLPLLPNHEQYLPSFKKELKVCEAKTVKYSVDEPPEVELKDLPPHLEYAFLEGINLEFYTHKILMEEDYKPAILHQRRVNPKIHDVIKKEVEKLLDAGLNYRSLIVLGSARYIVCLKRYFQIPIDPRDQEKTTFTCPYGTFAYRRMPFGLCNAPGTFQRCMLPIFHDMVENMMEVFMDDFSVFGNSFENFLSRLDKMLQRCEDTNLCLNWEKSHFMVKEGIVLGHKISKNGIEVDRAKVDVIAKLPHPTTVKDAKARLLQWVLLLQEFDFKVLDTKGVENLAVDHLSRLENPYENVLGPKEINETFLLETLSMMTFRGDSSAPWFADFANYHAGNFIVK
nr:reverse transcriptase domain-containing protein [Tanacetum cinerariifolium]